MKLSSAILGLLVVGFVVAHAQDVKQLFQDFKVKHNKQYDNENAEINRFAVFQANLAKIQRMNLELVAQGKDPVFGINALTDLTEEEFAERLMPKWTSLNQAADVSFDNYIATTDVKDWRDAGVVTPVKDQGQCGSCWAQAAVEAVESFDALAHNRTTPLVLSVQQATACTYSYDGCNGGWVEDAYVQGIYQRNGIVADSEYPYDIKQGGKCKFTGKADNPLVQLNSTHYKTVAKGQLRAALDQVGPVAVCLAASSFQYYTGGVMSSCTGQINHCVQAVGYNFAANPPYWIVRNSWSTKWGIEGYIHIDASVSSGNLCHIQEDVTFPFIA